jgi:hypothetical protein
MRKAPPSPDLRSADRVRKYHTPLSLSNDFDAGVYGITLQKGVNLAKNGEVVCRYLPPECFEVSATPPMISNKVSQAAKSHIF